MNFLLPSLQAERIRRSVVDYLTTMFALADTAPRTALAEFLEHPQHGVFTGPHIRLRLPYLPANHPNNKPTDAATTNTPEPTNSPLDWTPPFPPYRHQQQAWARLTTKNAHQPQPTIVTTGTGSGKTEAFLYPVLDHVLRARREGTTGIKAIILYPMNALATDQAGRLAKLITSDPNLTNVTAALYTGDASQSHTRVTADSLITSRHHIRSSPPDILLTNYKMLDQLLLRPEDQQLWRASANSLTYLILDEFHTYDGAQGTDVAMQLRRLGLALRDHLPADDPRRNTFKDAALGPITPVATSATLSDGNDPTAMLRFAEDVFGREFTPDAAVTETRYPLDAWAASHQTAAKKAGLEPRPLRALTSRELTNLADLGDESNGDPRILIDHVAAALYGLEDPLDDTNLNAAAIQSHPDVVRMIRAAQSVIPLADLVRLLLPEGQVDSPALGRHALNTILAALSAIRAGIYGKANRDAVSVEVTLWVREVRRVDRLVSTNPTFHWSDAAADNYAQDDADELMRPALYCRSCGRSGWGITLAPTGQGEKADQENVRRDRLHGDSRFRALIDASGEDAQYAELVAKGELYPEKHFPGLRWYSVDQRELLTRRPDPDDLATREGRVVPVLTLSGSNKEIEHGSRHDVCPSCQAMDSIRFLGSAVATLLSVTLTTLFGDGSVHDSDKRALIFTDSVQDAAHRAGFVDQRSNTMSLRSALRGALTDEMPLTAWVDATLKAAQDDPFDRYRLVPSALTTHERFHPYWDPDATPSKRYNAKKVVARRLLFDASLEVGLQSTFGRTLEATGAVSVHVDAGRQRVLSELARSVVGNDREGTLSPLEQATEQMLLAWVRGTLEHLRRGGGIDHEWLDRYKEESGARVWIWYKRKRNQGQPAFPTGRSAPAFAQVAGTLDTNRSTFTPVTSAKSWYAQWTKKCLHVSPQHGARLAAALFAALAKEGVLSATATKTGGTVYGIPPERVLVRAINPHQLESDPLLLVCGTCHTQLPAAQDTRDQLESAHCLTANCTGTLNATLHPSDSFYRALYESGNVRRVDAHEHTSLLESDVRAEVEEGFKRPVQLPGDPNVLVATPTLEMGIDIGDLSAVMLSSLPATVASYVQRVGRAGRRNGSALSLAFVPGRRDQLPHLEAPMRLLDGKVSPPSTYLGAEEILRRQFIASVVDRLAREGNKSVPGAAGGRADARAALGSMSEGSLLHTLLDRLKHDAPVLAADFAATFRRRTPGLARVTKWAADGEGPRFLLERAHKEYKDELALLEFQDKHINESLPELKAATDMPNASEEDKQAYRTAQGALWDVLRRKDDLRSEHWISALERRGVLPNYALIDDTVRLAARVSWRNPDTDDFESAPYDIDRGSQQALNELAPGAIFYAHGMEMRVDGIDGGDLQNQAEFWFCCPTCGYVNVQPPQNVDATPPSSCPRCLNTEIADVGRVRRVLRLTRVFADVMKDDARISDAKDTRTRIRFEVLPLPDFDPGRAERQWSEPSAGIGVTRYRNLHMRWLNTGRSAPTPAADMIGSWAVTGQDFRLCEACGKLDTTTGESSPRDHRAWCPKRSTSAKDDHVIQVDLMRDLTTEAVALLLPPALATDHDAVNSLGAAIFLGLEITTGGRPLHLGVGPAAPPISDGDPGETREAVLLWDLVPGGTGYLTDLAEPRVLWDLLVRTGQHLEQCECRNTTAHLCHECLLPHVPVGARAKVTRAAALLAIKQVLGLHAEEPVATLEADVPTWQVTEEPLKHGSGESPLEVLFRDTLEAKLKGSTSVRRVADPSGAPALVIDGGRWRVLPQKQAQGSLPDFTITPSSGDAKTIRVFTDGWQYHASPSHNRLTDDARKRASLRASGNIVLSVGKADLDGPWNPGWLDDAAVARLKSGMTGAARASGVTDQAVESWRGGPMKLLIDLLLEEGGASPGLPAEARTALAESVWGVLMIGATQNKVGCDLVSSGPADALWAATAHLLANQEAADRSGMPGGVDTGKPLPDGTSMSVFYWPHLSLAVQLRGTSTMEMALVLDDSPAAVEAADHRDSWLTWLRLSNVLPFADATVHITTTTAALEDLHEKAEYSAAAELLAASPDEPLSAHLAEVYASWKQLDREWTDELVLTLAPELAQRGVAFGVDGEEVEGGVMADLAWPDRRVAVLVEFPEDPEATADDARDLCEAGWNVVVLREKEEIEEAAAELAAALATTN